MEPTSGFDFGAGESDDEFRPRGRTHRADRRWSFLAGLALLVVGLAVLGYYWFLYDTAVIEYTGGESPPERRVHNLSRVSSRLAGMIGGGVLAILGALLCVHGHAEHGVAPEPRRHRSGGP